MAKHIRKTDPQGQECGGDGEAPQEGEGGSRTKVEAALSQRSALTACCTPPEPPKLWKGLQHCDIRASFPAALQQGLRLKDRDLRYVDFSNLTLDYADFGAAALTGSCLHGAKLRHANLKNVRGLQEDSLAAADLCGATLPLDLSMTESLSKVGDLSKSTGVLFTSLLAACGYCWLTIMTVPDAQLIADSASSNLPVIQSSISVGTFYRLAPIIIFALYLYFQLNLLRLWETISALPALFPDGKTLNQKTYPWLVNDLAGAYLSETEGKDPPLFWTQKALTILLAWWVVPPTMLAFWWGYLHVHQPLVTGLHALLLAASATMAWSLQRLGVATLRQKRGAEAELDAWRRPFRHPRTRRRFLAAALIFGVCLVVSRETLPVSVPQRVAVDPFSRQGSVPLMRLLAGDVTLAPVNPLNQANLDYSSIAPKPDGWDDATVKEREFTTVRQIDLRGADLIGARAYHAFLVHVNLQNAHLEWADLRHADVQMGDLFQAHLDNADLSDCHAENANLVGAHLGQAILHRTYLINADLRGADLRGADVTEAELTNADLRGANLRKADVTGANLTSVIVEPLDVGLWEGVIGRPKTWRPNLQAVFGPVPAQKAPPPVHAPSPAKGVSTQ